MTTETIWRELSDQLRKFIRSHVAASADVDDILQTVFLRIQGKLDILHQVEKLEAWVLQITRNAITDHYRKLPAARDDVATLRSPEVDQQAQNLNSEVAQCLGSLISHLPEDQHACVEIIS